MSRIALLSVRTKVYDCYLLGMKEEETCHHIGAEFKYVKQLFVEFQVYSAKIKANDFSTRLNQIATIERELFAAIEINKKNPKAEMTNKIAQLQLTYCKYLAL